MRSERGPPTSPASGPTPRTRRARPRASTASSSRSSASAAATWRGTRNASSGSTTPPASSTCSGPASCWSSRRAPGATWTAARGQAGTYFDALPEGERPRFQLLCDFQTFELLDRDEREETRFALADLPQHVEKFGFIIGVQRRTFRDQGPVNIKASELIARLHDALKASGYRGSRPGAVPRADRVLPVRRRHGHLRATRHLPGLHRGAHGPRWLRPRPVADALVPDARHAAQPAAGEARRGPCAVPARERRPVRRSRPHPGLRCRDAPSTARRGAVRLDRDLAGYLRGAVPVGHGAGRAPCAGSTLHDREEHPEGHRTAVPRRPAGRVPPLASSPGRSRRGRSADVPGQARSAKAAVGPDWPRRGWSRYARSTAASSRRTRRTGWTSRRSGGSSGRAGARCSRSGPGSSTR